MGTEGAGGAGIVAFGGASLTGNAGEDVSADVRIVLAGFEEICSIILGTMDSCERTCDATFAGTTSTFSAGTSCSDLTFSLLTFVLSIAYALVHHSDQYSGGI